MTNIEERTLHWVNRVVIGFNLCPFANAVVKSDLLSVQVESCDEPAKVLAALADHCETVLRCTEQFTMLVVLPNGFCNFDDFLDLVDLAQRLLVQLGLDDQLQIATFHPHYQFSETDYGDVENFTNRSPYPMLHILQEAAVTKAIKAHPDTESIPQRNIDLLQNMGPDKLKWLLNEENH